MLHVEAWWNWDSAWGSVCLVRGPCVQADTGNDFTVYGHSSEIGHEGQQANQKSPIAAPSGGGAEVT